MLTPRQQRFVEEYVRRALLPVLTPLAAAPGHPLPYLGNRSPCLVASIRRAAASALAPGSLSVVHVPSQALPRFVAVPDPTRPHVFMLLEDAIRPYLSSLHGGRDVAWSHAIRVTRDATLAPPGRAKDLIASIEASLRDRRLGTAVRLQYDAELPVDILTTLVDRTGARARRSLRGQRLHGLHRSPPALCRRRPAPAQGPAAAAAFRRRVRERAGHLERDPRRGHPRAPSLPRLRQRDPLRARGRG